MKKLVGLVGLAMVATAFNALASTQATATTAPRTATAAASGSDGFSMKDRFARESTRRGDRDASVYSIDHVTELQYRLRWEGVYKGPVTGTFGSQTKDGVKRYQRREGLRISGIATHRTWEHLIRDTIRHRGQIPRICKRDGWHAYYDRSMHQVTLWRNGVLRNSWLVRGGASSSPTRRGTNKVYYRDKDHRSGLYGSPMPYSQFFDGGQALHGSAAMMDPFEGHSHGCVNMYIEDARQLWRMTHDKRLVVTVYGAWD